MFYRIVEVKGDDEFIINTTEDKAAAIEEARDFWATLCRADKKRNRVEVREYETDPDELDYDDYNSVEWRYDSFMVSAIFPGGVNIDNEIVTGSDQAAVNTELTITKEWHKDSPPEYYIVSYYKDGVCIGDEMRQA